MTTKTKTIPRDPAWPKWARWYTTDCTGAVVWPQCPEWSQPDIGHGWFAVPRHGRCRFQQFQQLTRGYQERSIFRIVDPKPAPKRKAKRKAVSFMGWVVVGSASSQVVFRTRRLAASFAEPGDRVIRVRVEEVAP